MTSKTHSLVASPSHSISDLVSRIEREFPEIGGKCDFSEGPYVVLSEFALLLVEQIRGGTISDDEIEHFFEMVNRACSPGDPDVHNVVQVSIFEIFTDHSEVVDLVRCKLEGMALELFEETFERFGSPAR